MAATTATLVTSEGKTFSGTLNFASRGDGLTEGTFVCESLMTGISNREFTIHTENDSGPLVIRNALALTIATEGYETTVTFRANSLELGNSVSGSPIESVLYHVTNCAFMGSGLTQSSEAQSISFRRDRISFASTRFNAVLAQLPEYDTIIEALRHSHGIEVTATLQICPALPKDAVEDQLDDFADAVCELLSFATKNTVQWVRKKVTPKTGAPAATIHRRVANLRPFTAGWSLIPDIVASGAPSLGRFELLNFLNQCIEKYTTSTRHAGLQMAIAWRLDAEHQTSIDMQYVAAFICIEWMKSKLLSKQSKAPPTFSDDWQKAISGQLGASLIQTVESSLGHDLTELQRKMFLNALRSANNPPIAEQLKALCEQFGVVGFEKDMADFRSRLVHTGSYGDFDFQDAIGLLRRLSHVIDQVILKALEYKGYYTHWQTDWKPTAI